MTRTVNRSVRNLVLGAGAALCAGGGGAAVGEDRAPAEELLRIAADEPLLVRFARPVTASRVGAQPFQIVRESDGAPAIGRFVAGTFAPDPETGIAMMIDPESLIETAMIERGLDRAAATKLVERAEARYARTGSVAAYSLLRNDLARLDSAPAGPQAYDPRLDHDSDAYRSLPQQDESAPAVLRDLRRIQSGDDALWESYVVDNDLSAFATLEQDPDASRFHHSIDPLTGNPNAESDYRRRQHRRYLFKGAASGRIFTFVPDVPQTAGLADTAFEVNERYRVTFAAGLPAPLGGLLTFDGRRGAVHRRVAYVESAGPAQGEGGPPSSEPLFALSELKDLRPPRVTDITPPAGERLVDPTTDWENPSNRFTTPRPDRNPFVVRLHFNVPLDPRTVSPVTFTLTQRRASIGTQDERMVNVPVPVTVRLRQSRLGDVEVEMAPRLNLDPAAEYEVVVRDVVRSLDGHSPSIQSISSFTTAPLASYYEVLIDYFTTPSRSWVEADTASPRTLVAADAAHDPDGAGLFVPFLGDDPVPVTAIQSAWLSGGSAAPRYVTNFNVSAAAQGSSVRVFARTTLADPVTAQPNLFLVGPWVEMDSNAALPGYAFVQLRIEFTLQPGATASTLDLPSVDRMVVIGRVP